MNSEQIKSLIRQLMLFIGGLIAGTSFVSKFFTVEQVTTILTSQTVVNTLAGLITAGIASAWGLIARSDKNLVASANALPQVQAVITKPTPEGKELANAVPSPAVVPAGTRQAEALAQS